MKINYNKILLLFFSIFRSSLCLINQDKFVEDLLYLVNQTTEYSSTSGNNILNYIDGIFYCDCSGMIKALLNEYDIYNVEDRSKPSGFPITKDINSKQLIDGCEDISDDFIELIPPSPRVRFLYMDTPNRHIGVFIGKEVQCGENKGDICNVVECTSSWSRGIQLSYVDHLGNRYNKQGGKKESKWIKHGLPTKWLEYNCKYIFDPKNSSDCILSENDKKYYKYCCYEKNSITNKCSPFTKEDYYLHLNTIDILKKLGDYEFECQTEKEEVNPESSDCEQIEPKKASDCKLSENDKKKFIYCCYEEIEDEISGCGAYTQESYEDELEIINELKNLGLELSFDCNVKENGDQNYISYFLKHFELLSIFFSLLL